MPLVVLTGATRGIGRAAAIELSRRGAEVAIVGRDAQKVREVAAAAPGTTYEYVADLERMDEVRRLAAELLEHHARIDVLANNAGAMFTSRHVTADGFERTFALNHLAPFLLTELLLQRLRDSRARVVTTASDAHGAAELDFDDLQWEDRPFRAMRVYGTTKLCNVLFTRELARREPELVATCLHPGVVRTGFGKNDGLLYRAGLTLISPFLRSPERGARSLVWLALSDEAAGLSGSYVQDEKVLQPSAAAQDEMVAGELWRRSEELVGVTAG
jgi:NAD(P)-dependent dehydrogenase (short-subunit alcohol dehydrogenase family)